MELQRNKDVTRYSAYKTRATSEFFVEITNTSDLFDLAPIIRKMQSESLPVAYIAGGTNLLFAFDHFEWLMVHIRMSWTNFHSLSGSEGADRAMLTAFSGTPLAPVVIEAIEKHGAKSLLPWVGLPGTVGGAIVGNAGCFWLETSDFLVEAEVFDLQAGESWVFTCEELEFSYRKSLLKNQDRFILISGTFDISFRNEENPYEYKTIEEMRIIRREKQPPGISCGSFFTNPVGMSAGKLIDDAGLKWFSIGGAQISPLHGNFLMNTWWASWTDVVSLAQHAKTRVRELFQIELLEEVRILGRNSTRVPLNEAMFD